MKRTKFERELRDKFALAAMQAIIRKHPAQDVPVGRECFVIDYAVARSAYDYADAMMDVRWEDSL